MAIFEDMANLTEIMCIIKMYLVEDKIRIISRVRTSMLKMRKKNVITRTRIKQNNDCIVYLFFCFIKANI